MIERWKPIKGYEGRYEVSNMGRVKSLKMRGRSAPGILRPGASKRRYALLMVKLFSAPKIGKNFRVHRLVLETFTGKKPSGCKIHAAHKNGDHRDNRLSNLYWTSAKENYADKARHGRPQTGKNAASYKHGRYCKAESYLEDDK